MGTKATLQGDCFGKIAQRSRSTMGVDVIHLVRIYARITHGIYHPAGRALSIFAWSRNVVRIGAHTIPGQLAINPGAPCLRVLQFFEHQYTGPLAQHESVAIDVPRTARGRRIIVARTERTCRRETADAERANRRL